MALRRADDTPEPCATASGTSVGPLELPQALADETTTQRLNKLVPCDMTKVGCDKTFVYAFATKAFRRPATDDEVTALLTVAVLMLAGRATFDRGAKTPDEGSPAFARIQGPAWFVWLGARITRAPPAVRR